MIAAVASLLLPHAGGAGAGDLSSEINGTAVAVVAFGKGAMPL
jgi:hypothetical protein